MKNKAVWFRMFIVSLVIAGLAVLASCSGGSTSGDSSSDLVGTQFVADGGAGSTLSISVTGTLTTAGTTGFFVRALDPQGQPLAFIKIFCDTESGIAIIEPAEGGVAVETTDSNGSLSGVLGGLTPGSYIMRCEAANGFGLVAHTAIIVRGDVPENFAGFPGAAGGNLGGGRVIDQTPSTVDDGGIFISSVGFVDAGQSTTGPHQQLDMQRDICARISTTDGTIQSCTAEPFFFKNYNIGVTNNTNEFIQVQTISFTIGGTTPLSSPALAQTAQIDSGGSTTLVGSLTQNGSVLSGTSTAIGIRGTVDVDVTVAGVTETGQSFTVTGSTPITFGNVNNCGSNTNVGSSCTVGGTP